MDYGWLDLMYRMYPNMQGVFNTENFWAGIHPPCEGSAKMLEIADRFGGFFVWSDQDHGSSDEYCQQCKYEKGTGKTRRCILLDL